MKTIKRKDRKAGMPFSKLVFLLFGILSSLLLMSIGFFLTQQLENYIGIIISAVYIPFLGRYVYINEVQPKKAFGLGILIGSIPIVILVLAFLILSGLH